MRTTYMALAAVAAMFLALTGVARAEATEVPVAVEQPEGAPLGLLLDENGMPFADEIIIKDGFIYT